MHPLFLAHLIGDFLLQPKWLVDLKQRSLHGIFFHAVIHGVVMILLVQPRSWAVLVSVVALAVLHAIIDIVKVRSQRGRGGFYGSFLLDQLMHISLLTAVAATFKTAPDFWFSPGGLIVSLVLGLLCLGIALFHIIPLTVQGEARHGKTARRTLLILLTFTMATVPGLVLGALRSGAF